ncbi:hypothetical protein QC764_105555 [Podospora pseudoanserina]|uniref:Uncharacterized protein n=1 Tax=Podospora pseudoanserina TaxID=2609844 RepID=A0ABR0IN43_9PEZI|nr:hypothetical protein QC764_105555 [Podospora pseudoanserina]
MSVAQSLTAEGPDVDLNTRSQISGLRILVVSLNIALFTPYFNIAPTCCIHLFGATGYFTSDLLYCEPHSNMEKTQREAVRSNFDYAAFFRKACKLVRAWTTFFAARVMKYKNDFGEEAATEKYGFIIDLWKEMQHFELVRDQLLHVLMAGRDALASLLAWTL